MQQEDALGQGERVVVVCSSVQDGTEARLIRIEASFGRGFAGLQLIGHTGHIVEDGKERARMAIERLGLSLPPRRLLLSVSPGDIKAEGSHMDLACAVAMAGLIREQEPTIPTSRWVFAAEIGLTGELRPIPGVVGHGVTAMAAGMDGVVVADENLRELRALEAASFHTGKKLVYQSFRTLSEVIDWLWSGQTQYHDATNTDLADTEEASPTTVNFDDMDLDASIELAAMTAAAGMHSMILRGVPGCGKSMFAKRLPSLLPDLTPEEHLIALQIHSCHSERIASPILRGRPPYRSPHHFASSAALLGAHDRPGEVALASGGVLFLDEFPEFRRDVIEALREPLESGEVQVSRAHSKRVWRAKMMLIAAANNCPCGWRGSARRRCHCAESRVSAYRNRLSGPILDRIDLHVNMPERVEGASIIFGDTLRACSGRTARMQKQVAAARYLAEQRNRAYSCRLNRDIPPQHLASALGMSATDIEWISHKLIPAHVSTRALVRCLRVARTLADLADREQVDDGDVAQAWSWQACEAARLRGETIQ